MGASSKVLAYLQGVTARQSRAEIAAGSGVDGDTVSKILYNWIKRGRAVEDDRKLVLLNPEFVPYAQQKKPRKLPPKVRGFKAAARAAKAKAAAKKPRTYGDLLDKIRADCPSPVFEGEPNIGRLLVQHARTTFNALKLTIDLLGAEPCTVAAFESHAQALSLLEGGRHV